MKDRVLATRVPDLPTLRARIHDVIATVTREMLDRTWVETEFTLYIVPPVGHMPKFTKLNTLLRK
jgi:hypothetical protein